MDESADAAAALVEEAIAWLREHYDQFEFWVERDPVWAVQARLRQLIAGRHLPYGVFNDYPLLAGARRARSADTLGLLGFQLATSLPTDQSDLIAEPRPPDRRWLPAGDVLLSAPPMPPPARADRSAAVSHRPWVLSRPRRPGCPRTNAPHD